MAGEIGRSPLQRSNPADAAITPWGNSLTISDPELARSREKIDESKKIGIAAHSDEGAVTHEKPIAALVAEVQR
jgi:hypothetical protein